MKIIVCIKQVPGTSEVDIDETTGTMKREGVDSKMNPYDLYALETALRIKEKNKAEVTVITMGPPQAAAIIREAYMTGADKGILVSDRKFAGADVVATSYTLSQAIKKSGMPDLIICGKQTTDGDTAQVGAEIAEFLGIPNISYVKKIIEVKLTSIILESELDYSYETVEASLPCLISVEKGIYEPRLPSYRLKQITKNNEITAYSLNDFEDRNESKYGLKGSPTQVVKIFPPSHSTVHQKWEGSAGEVALRLADKLTELKFI